MVKQPAVAVVPGGVPGPRPGFRSEPARCCGGLCAGRDRAAEEDGVAGGAGHQRPGLHGGRPRGPAVGARRRDCPRCSAFVCAACQGGRPRAGLRPFQGGPLPFACQRQVRPWRLRTPLAAQLACCLNELDEHTVTDQMQSHSTGGQDKCLSALRCLHVLRRQTTYRHVGQVCPRRGSGTCMASSPVLLHPRRAAAIRMTLPVNAKCYIYIVSSLPWCATLSSIPLSRMLPVAFSLSL